MGMDQIRPEILLFPNSFSLRVLVGLSRDPRGWPPSACGFCRVDWRRPVFDDSYTLLMHFGPSMPAQCPLNARCLLGAPGCSWVAPGCLWVLPGGLLVAFRVPPGCASVAPGCPWVLPGCLLRSHFGSRLFWLEEASGSIHCLGSLRGSGRCASVAIC